MRLILRILRNLGLTLSTLLLLATGVFWVRSVGYHEGCHFHNFTPYSDWYKRPAAEMGFRRTNVIATTQGRLWLEWRTTSTELHLGSRMNWWRTELSAEMAQAHFDRTFLTGEWTQDGALSRGWNFAGLGFRYKRSEIAPMARRPRDEGIGLAIPFWMLTLLFALWPALFTTRRILRRRRRNFRIRHGLCLHCGYDLRATPDPNGPRLPRCPECGRAVAEA